MSKQGQLSRGAAYYKLRDVNGNYPLEMTANESIMDDLKVYIDSLPKVEEEKISKKKGKVV